MSLYRPYQPAEGLFIVLLTLVFCLHFSASSGLAAPCDTKSGYNFVQHDLTQSYCELCGYGYVTVETNNPYSYTYTYDGSDPEPDSESGAIMSDLVLETNLGLSGLEYDPSAPDPVIYSVNGGINNTGSAPGISGSTLAFSSNEIPPFSSLLSEPNDSAVNSITVRFAVRRTSTPEGLVSANRQIESTLAFDTDSSCSDSSQSATATLPLREPIPEVTKTGWNYDAGQRQSSETETVYGNNNDDVVWRVRIDNNGLAGMQDLRFDDIMAPDSLVISHACTTETGANTLAANNGSISVTGCVAASNVINDFIVSDPFGNMGLSFDNYEVDVSTGGSTSIYLVGKVDAGGSCQTSRLNTVSDIQWGCTQQSPTGGISETSTFQTPGTINATFYSQYLDGPDHEILTVERHLTGTNTSQPVGSNGMMTIIIRNNSGGSVKNIELADVLPSQYVVDATFPPELTVTPYFGSDYSGIVDTLTWTNPADSSAPLTNTNPHFSLTSSTFHTDYPDQENMLRQGDVAVIRFRVVLITSDYYDRSANLDVNPEEFGTTATDPDAVPDLLNELTVDFDVFCSTQGSGGHFQLVLDGNGDDSLTENGIPADPEDLDIAVGGAVFILTNNPTQILTLPIEVTNNGGHDAADYHTFVALGTTMEVVGVPPDCSLTGLNSTLQPDPWKVWIEPASATNPDPITLPATATIYECNSSNSIAPGETVTYNFDVIKATDAARIAEDDLSLRADVIGEITLSNATLLDFPAPITRDDGETDRANNYSLDATWARVIGFNLLKTQIGTCTENNPPSYDGNNYEEVQIGEECSYHIETGGWFGFDTPGFAYISVQNIDVVDEVPNGQAYISNTDPTDESTMGVDGVQGIILNPAGLTALTEGWFDWRFNVPDGQRIEDIDVWFIVNTTTRLLNSALDERSAPNYHSIASDNVLNSTFDATFSNVNTGQVEQYSLDSNTVGYPIESVRRVDLRVTEPLLTVVKEVCNENLHGIGPSCSNFAPVADDGDAYSNYIYRLTVTNTETSSGFQRAPAYDVTVTDQLDASDLAYVYPFASDGLDNDGDGSSGGADSDGEGSNSDNSVQNGIPAELTFSHLHSSALERIAPGQSVELYYRVDYDDDAAPLQTFTNSAYATYDSLEGDSGSQTLSPQINSTLGGARFYTSATASADVVILPVEIVPKEITLLANTPLLSDPGTQEIAVGEELEYELTALLPVALLRDFVIRDELPTGMRCVEAPDVDLDAAPYNSAGFDPGGVITPSCSDDQVEWVFGDQRLTIGTGSDRFEFPVTFIAQVLNSSDNNEGELLSNGIPATEASFEYRDETENLISYFFGQADVQVTEPLIDLSQAFSVAVADAADTITVTVTATNIGTAPAYNLRVLVPLTGTPLSYAADLGGTNPPDNIDVVTLGADQPILSWAAPNNIDVGASVSFTFDILIADSVQPHQLLETTLEADWTSLPDQNSALNSGGSIDVNGSTNGMRNGTLPNGGDSINDYETTATTALTIALPTLEKTDQDTDMVPTVGAHKPFRILLSLAEGVTNEVVISDSLNAAGLSYVLANNDDFDITYTFSGIATINGLAASEGAFNSFPADGSSNLVSWDIGSVATQTEDDSSTSAITPAIQLDYYARVNNDTDTDAGDQLQNGIELSYLNTETTTAETLNDDTDSVTVSEPNLSLNKTLINATVGKAPGDAPVAMDTLEYQLIFLNNGSSNSTAFDINIIDDMPDGLTFDAGFTPTATIDGVAVPGFVATPTESPAGILRWGRDNGDDSLDLPAGQLLVITYHATVTIISNPSGLVENGVWSDWTSLADVSSYERTGVGCPTTIAPNDYCVGPVYASTVGIAPELDFQKAVINDTTGANPGTTANPGDTLRYRLQTTSVTNAAAAYQISDEIDALNSSPYFVPGSLTMVSVPSGTDTTDPSGGSAGTGLISISDLTLEGLDSETIEFTIQLAPVIADGSVVLNQAELLLFGFGTTLSDNPNVSGGENPTQTLITSTPLWQIEKTVEDLTGASSVLFPGDTLRYTISVKNIGTENSSDVLLRDSIPANTTYIADSTTLNSVAVTDPSSGVSAVEAGMLINTPEDSSAGAMRADSDVAADNVATITFEVQVDTGTASGTAIANQAFVDGTGEGSGAFSDQPSDDPTTATNNDATIITVSGIDFIKSVTNDTQGGSGATAEPSDILRYQLSLTNTGSEELNNLSVIDEIEGLQATEATYFVPGSLTITSIPTGADSSASDANGGTKGTGIVEVSDISIAAGATATIEFTLELAAVITSGTQVLNQAQLSADDTSFLLSDSDDTVLTGEEDPTLTLVSSEPQFLVHKTATLLGADPTILLAGETVRYSIMIWNIGNEDAVAVQLQDYTPSNTTYVAGSTTLNGAAVADASGGVNPLHDGIMVTTATSSTAGAVPADASAAAANSATVTFEVLVDADAMDGTIIENQGFVQSSGAGSGVQPQQPSDDPTTATPDDPTRNVVGNLPLLYALKTVELSIDNGSAGIVDAGDSLRYTIVISNSGAIPATDVILTDTVPADTLYVDDSTTLNGVSLGSDGGVLPTISGLAVQSSDNPGSGIISAGESTEITFEVQVAGGTATGSIISNQGSVSSSELADLLTDADGLPGNGYQPTEIAVGDVQQLSITLDVAVTDGGSAEPGAELAYTIQVTNIGSLPATLVSVLDDLSPPLGDQLNYVSGSATLNGLSTGTSFFGDLLTADFASIYGELAVGETLTVRFNAVIDSTLAYGTTITNTAEALWNSPQQSATASVSIDVGGTPDGVVLNGNVWHDVDFDSSLTTTTESAQGNWDVALYLDGSLIATTTTDDAGAYQFSGLIPSAYVTGLYALEFSAPGAGANTATLGYASSLFNNGLQSISDISVTAGNYLQNLDMPLWPNGTIYDSVTRTAISDATLTMYNSSTETLLPANCFDDPAQQGQVTTVNGFYKFDLNFSQSTCPANGSYRIAVEEPVSDYLETPSLIIPPTSDETTTAFSVPACPGSAADAIPATAGYCEAIATSTAPPLSVAANSSGTTYYLHLTYANGTIPGQSQIFNNSIPIDPILDGAVAITKKAEITSVSKGSLVPYTITVTNVFGAPLEDVQIVDRFPAGFKYIADSALVNGVKMEPVQNGRALYWNDLSLEFDGTITVRLLLIVGSGVGEGEYINRAWVYNTVLDSDISGEASATVAVVPDPDFDCTDIIGKVFDDRNLNGTQDSGEGGLAGARVATAQGLSVTTDLFGRYSITCAVVPDEDRGSNFIMKLDDRSLPVGYRVVTENPRVQRATRGKMMRYNFGATLHRVVSINIADAAFEKESLNIRPQWQDKLDELLEVLQEAPSILRLSYLGDIEGEKLVNERLKMIRNDMKKRWDELDRDYSLTMESEIFWRRGAPVKH